MDLQATLLPLTLNKLIIDAKKRQKEERESSRLLGKIAQHMLALSSESL